MRNYVICCHFARFATSAAAAAVAFEKLVCGAVPDVSAVKSVCITRTVAKSQNDVQFAFLGYIDRYFFCNLLFVVSFKFNFRDLKSMVFLHFCPANVQVECFMYMIFRQSVQSVPFGIFGNQHILPLMF